MKGMQQPFLSAKVKVEKERQQDIASVRAWLAHQPHLPPLTDEHILMFLHCNYFSLERAKDNIESYYTVRAEHAETFDNWDYALLADQFKLMEMAALNGNTPEGYRVIMYRLKEVDASVLVLAECMKAFFAYNDYRISEDGLVAGYVVIFDMTGCSLAHLAKVAAALPLIKLFMQYIQECHPVRLKGVHIINTVPFIDRALALIKPFMQSELIQLLHLHTSVSGLEDFMPLSLLPEDYGGLEKSMTLIHGENQEQIKKNYVQWLKDCNKCIADLKKRPAKSKGVSSMQGSFRTLSID